MGMKASTIKLVINRKLTEWLESITNEQVRALARDNVIVSGGAIASMLLGEKVNDYDVYFRTEEATLEIAKYYAELFNAKKGELAHRAAKGCNPQVRREVIKNCKGVEENRILFWMQSSGVAGENQSVYEYFESRPETATDEFVASLGDAEKDMADSLDGGFDDNDPFALAEGVVEVVRDRANKDDLVKKYRPVFFSDNAVSLAGKMQLVVRFYGTPEEIHENYDFAHAMCYYDHKAGKLELPHEALESLLSKALIYKGSLYPIASLFRIRKFINRGWRITAGQMLKIIWQVSQLKLDDKAVLREQLIGVDQAYMVQLLSAIQTTEEKIDGAYIARLVDEIFE
jgi:hypothetical protein